MKNVLFACVHNAGRSQMAAAWFRELADPAKASATSAGTVPGTAVHPEVLDAMRELGIDLSQRKPELLSDELAQRQHWLITMGCGEACPVVPGLRRDDWPLEDPKNKPIARVREIREQVRQRVAALIRREGWTRDPEPARAEDVGSALALLRQAELPIEGVEVSFPSQYVVVRSDRGVVGIAGLERYASYGLLRSLAVAPAFRGAGLGRALIDDRLRAAQELDLSSVYVLTTTATDYFRSLGFEETSRSEAPAALQESAEFTSLCPSTATCLVKTLRSGD